MTLEGTVKNGVIVVDSPECLSEGMRVEVIVNQTPAGSSPLAEVLLRHAGTATGLPEDLAAQHDHYLHGTPKR